jgi:ATP-binding cassette subfamily B protein
MFDDEMDFSRAVHPWRSLGKLLKYVKPFLPVILLALLCAGGSAVAAVVAPNYLRGMTDAISLGLAGVLDMAAVRRVALALCLIYALSILLTYIQGYIMATVAQKIGKNMRTEIDGKLSRLPFRYFDSTTYGNIISRVTNDVDTVNMTLTETIISIITNVLRFVGAIVMMLITNVPLALLTIATSVIGFSLMSLIIGHTQKLFMARQEGLGVLNGYIEEQCTGLEVVKAFSLEDRAISEFRRQNTALYESVWKSEFYSGLMMPIMMFVGNISYVAVCVVGGYLAASGKISFGVIVAFILYARMFSEPLDMLAQTAVTFQSTAAASERIFELMEEPEEAEESGKPEFQAAAGKVSFQHVRFGYDPEKPVICDFSAEARAGQKIAIVGPTGAGKTTLVNLLMRFYEPDSGSILIDGVDISSVNRSSVRKQFCMVLQDTWLFEGTVRENLVYATPGITDEMLDAAVRAAGLEHFIGTLAEGYDTLLTDRASLSAGQKQQLTIARAIISNAPILILDEATSSVDTRTELLIQNAMDKLMEGRTSFVIAHRLSTVRNADLILCLKDGDIVEQGSHDELLALGGFYADLYNSQFEHDTALPEVIP